MDKTMGPYSRAKMWPFRAPPTSAESPNPVASSPIRVRAYALLVGEGPWYPEGDDLAKSCKGADTVSTAAVVDVFMDNRRWVARRMRRRR
jgi:hypothetical protein